MRHFIRSLSFILLSLIVLGCNSDDTVKEISETPINFLPLISDGVNDGNKKFYFLPPMVDNPNYSGIFDPSYQPVVRILELTSGEVTSVLEQFDFSNGLSVDISEENYKVEWHTNEYDLNSETTYRIEIRVDDIVVGFADVDVVNSGKELKNVNTNEFIPLKDGRTLPIKFRVETGVNFKSFPIDENGGIISINDNSSPLNGFMITVPAGAFSGPDVIIVESLPGNQQSGYDLVALSDVVFEITTDSGLAQFSENIEFKFPLDEIDFSNQDIPILGVFDKVASEWIYVEDIQVDEVANTLVYQTSHFSKWSLGRGIFSRILQLADEMEETLALNGLGFDFYQDINENLPSYSCEELSLKRDQILGALDFSYDQIILASQQYTDCQTRLSCEELYGDATSLGDYYLNILPFEVSGKINIKLLQELIKSNGGKLGSSFLGKFNLLLTAYKSGLLVDCQNCLLGNAFGVSTLGNHLIQILSVDILQDLDNQLEALECGKVDFDENLIAYYPFNGNALDESGNGNDGTVNGAVLTTDRNGMANSAYQFNDSGNKRISLGTSINPANMNSITVSTWIRTSVSFANCCDGASQVIIGQGDGTSSGSRFPFLLQYSFNGRLGFKRGRGAIETEPRFQGNDGEWHMITGTAEGTSFKLYFDGVLVASREDGPLPGGTNYPLSIGNIGDTQGTFGNTFNGDIDDLRIYDAVLDAQKIFELYEYEKPLPQEEDGLIAYYPFNGNANDETGNGNDGTVIGASLAADRFGNPNSAFEFNGVDEWIEVAHNQDLNLSNEFTLSIWFNTVNPITQQELITKGADPWNHKYSMYLTNTDHWLRSSIGGVTNRTNSNVVQPIGQWVHAVSTYKDGLLSTYANGVLLDQSTVNYTSIPDNTEDLFIGRSTNFFNGLLDDIRLFNKGLSGQEVQDLYDQEKPLNNDPMLMAYYPFNGNANDESGNGNDALVFGSVLTSDRNGTSSSAYFFDGLDDYIQIPKTTNNEVGSEDFSVSLWFKSSTTDEGVLFNTRNTSSCSQAFGPSWGMSQTSAVNGNRLGAIARSGSEYQQNSANAVSDGLWHHAVWVREGATLRLYLDGNLETTTSIDPSIDFTTLNDLYLGRTIYCSGNYFEGEIDDFAIFRGALSVVEINDFLNNYSL